MEATILQRPFEALTVKDIQKINALLLHGMEVYYQNAQGELVRDQGKAGAFRKERMWLPQSAAQPSREILYALKNVQDKIDLHDEDSLELSEFLTEEEYALYNEWYVETPAAPLIAQMLEELLDSARDLLHTKKAPFAVIAAYIHVFLTKIHPFKNGNGRTARLMANYLLMKGGRLPFVVIDPFLYAQYVKDGDTDLSYMNHFMGEQSSLARECKGLQAIPYSLQGDLHTQDFSLLLPFSDEYYFGPFKESIKEELEKHCYTQLCPNLPVNTLEAEQYQTLLHSIAVSYDALSPEQENFEEGIRGLKRLCLQALSFSDKLCAKCSQVESDTLFKRCARCKKVFYCSPACQKEDWGVHKQNCT